MSYFFFFLMSNNKMWKCRIQERREKKHFGTFSRPPEVQQIFAWVCISGIFFIWCLIQCATNWLPTTFDLLAPWLAAQCSQSALCALMVVQALLNTEWLSCIRVVRARSLFAQNEQPRKLNVNKSFSWWHYYTSIQNLFFSLAYMYIVLQYVYHELWVLNKKKRLVNYYGYFLYCYLYVL